MNEMQAPPPIEPRPKRALSRLEVLRGKWERCKDPYWRWWLESAIRFAMWQETGRPSAWAPASTEEAGADAGIIET